MTIPSLFIEHDPKRHMSINLDTGLWQCFKSGQKGNFLKLYSQLENIEYGQAYKKFLVEEFFAEEVKVVKETKQAEAIPTDFIQVGTDTDDDINSRAVMALIDRNILDYGPFYFTREGVYRNRLIIPYRNNDRMFYFQARALLPNQEPKYLNFRGMKSSSILFPFTYDSIQPLYICEGAIDAMSLQMLGYNATTTISCHVSRQQLEQLKHYQGPIVIAYDNDKAGRDGLRSFEMMRRKMRMSKISYVFPPTGYKDWNEAFVTNPTFVHHAIKDAREFNLHEWDISSELNTWDLI